MAGEWILVQECGVVCRSTGAEGVCVSFGWLPRCLGLPEPDPGGGVCGGGGDGGGEEAEGGREGGFV